MDLAGSVFRCWEIILTQNPAGQADASRFLVEFYQTPESVPFLCSVLQNESSDPRILQLASIGLRDSIKSNQSPEQVFQVFQVLIELWRRPNFPHSVLRFPTTACYIDTPETWTGIMSVMAENIETNCVKVMELAESVLSKLNSATFLERLEPLSSLVGAGLANPYFVENPCLLLEVDWLIGCKLVLAGEEKALVGYKGVFCMGMSQLVIAVFRSCNIEVIKQMVYFCEECFDVGFYRFSLEILFEPLVEMLANPAGPIDTRCQIGVFLEGCMRNDPVHLDLPRIGSLLELTVNVIAMSEAYEEYDDGEYTYPHGFFLQPLIEVCVDHMPTEVLSGMAESLLTSSFAKSHVAGMIVAGACLEASEDVFRPFSAPIFTGLCQGIMSDKESTRNIAHIVFVTNMHIFREYIPMDDYAFVGAVLQRPVNYQITELIMLIMNYLETTDVIFDQMLEYMVRCIQLGDIQIASTIMVAMALLIQKSSGKEGCFPIVFQICITLIQNNNSTLKGSALQTLSVLVQNYPELALPEMGNISSLYMSLATGSDIDDKISAYTYIPRLFCTFRDPMRPFVVPLVTTVLGECVINYAAVYDEIHASGSLERMNEYENSLLPMCRAGIDLLITLVSGYPEMFIDSNETVVNLLLVVQHAFAGDDSKITARGAKLFRTMLNSFGEPFKPFFQGAIECIWNGIICALAKEDDPDIYCEVARTAQEVMRVTHCGITKSPEPLMELFMCKMMAKRSMYTGEHQYSFAYHYQLACLIVELIIHTEDTSFMVPYYETIMELYQCGHTGMQGIALQILRTLSQKPNVFFQPEIVTRFIVCFQDVLAGDSNHQCVINHANLISALVRTWGRVVVEAIPALMPLLDARIAHAIGSGTRDDRILVECLASMIGGLDSLSETCILSEKQMEVLVRLFPAEFDSLMNADFYGMLLRRFAAITNPELRLAVIKCISRLFIIEPDDLLKSRMIPSRPLIALSVIITQSVHEFQENLAVIFDSEDEAVQCVQTCAWLHDRASRPAQ